MSEPTLGPETFEETTNIDRLIHEPARLVILSVLAECRSANFMYLQSITGLTKGNLSVHLSKLAARGLIAVDKKFVDNNPRTTLRLTKEGRTAIRAYWRQIEKTRAALKSF